MQLVARKAELTFQLTVGEQDAPVAVHCQDRDRCGVECQPGDDRQVDGDFCHEHWSAYFFAVTR